MLARQQEIGSFGAYLEDEVMW